MLLDKLLRANFAASQRLEKMLPSQLTLDGNRDFQNSFAWRYIRPGIVIYDIGGGKQPFLSAQAKSDLKARVIGLDVSAAELALAPSGSYDATIVADIQDFRGTEKADLAICQAVLEHIPRVDAALAAISTLLKPGGYAVVFVPCENAAFAILNRILPENLKRRILFSAFPEARESQGFRSYYDHCTPSALTRLAAAHGLTAVELKTYYSSGYFRAFFPAQLIWRVWTMAVAATASQKFCETFSLALRKRDDA
jgi:SAM-dependent methyltransferase